MSNNLKPEVRREAVTIAAKSIQDTNIVLAEEARRIGVSRSTMTELRMIAEHGTASDLAAFLEGSALRTIYEKVRDGLPADARKKHRARTGQWSGERRELLSGEKSLWGKLSPALRGLTELPNPASMISVVKSNRMREQAVDQYLDAAFNWMEEFKSEWIKFRAAKSGGHSSDSGKSDPTAGTEHPKPPSE